MYDIPSIGVSKPYGDWLIVSEMEYMLKESPMRSLSTAKLYSEFDELDTTYTSGLTQTNGIKDSDFDKIVAEKIDQINRETNDDVMKIRHKLEKIQSRWEEGNMQRYIDGNNSHPQLNKIDQLLGEAMKEVAEIQKGANIAVMELTKSVENVDELYSKTMDLKDSTGKFRKTAYEEKASMPVPLKTQLVIGVVSLIAIKFIISFFS